MRVIWHVLFVLAATNASIGAVKADAVASALQVDAANSKAGEHGHRSCHARGHARQQGPSIPCAMASRLRAQAAALTPSPAVSAPAMVAINIHIDRASDNLRLETAGQFALPAQPVRSVRSRSTRRSGLPIANGTPPLPHRMMAIWQVEEMQRAPHPSR